MFTTGTHVLARGARQEGERVLLTCPLSQRCLDHVRCRKSQIILFPPPRHADRALPVLSDTTPAAAAAACGLLWYTLSHAVWITCTVSANAHLTQPKRTPPWLSLSRLRCKAHSTRELRLLWTTALLYTSHSLLLLSSNHLASLPSSIPSLLFLTPANITSRVPAATLPSPPLIVRHKLGC
jgi:hypothetical protein